MQTILGANGTIGKILAKELPVYTDRIRLVSRNPIRVNETDELMPLDLTQPGAVDKAVQGSEIVYLVVGLEYKLKVWEKYWPALMRDTINACLKHGAKLVFFDNVYMYDKNHLSQLTENAPVNPPSRKGAVRKWISDMVLESVKSMGLKGLIARSADFYGPGNESNFITQMVLKNLSAGKNPMWFMGSGIKHSFTYTPDAGKATALLGNTPDAYGEVWHLPTSDALLTGKDWVGLFAREMNAKTKLSALPDGMLTLLGLCIPILKELKEMTYQYNRDYFFNSNKFNQRFGYKPLSPEESVKNLVAVLRHSS